jgi:hypothetical protein
MKFDSQEYKDRIESEMLHIERLIKAHQLTPTKDSKAFRKADPNNMFFIHPLWCALLILFEAKLPEHIKREGYLTLLYHDVLEDTTSTLPDDLSPRVVELISHMTFMGGTKQERLEIWDKEPVVRLYKLYDKISNMMDDRWPADTEKRDWYFSYITELMKDVEKEYGNLRIVQMARMILSSV